MQYEKYPYDKKILGGLKVTKQSHQSSPKSQRKLRANWDSSLRFSMIYHVFQGKFPKNNSIFFFRDVQSHPDDTPSVLDDF